MPNPLTQVAGDLHSRVETTAEDLKRHVDSTASKLSDTLDTPFRQAGFRGAPGDVVAPLGDAATSVIGKTASRFLLNPLRIAQGIGEAIDTLPQTFQKSSS